MISEPLVRWWPPPPPSPHWPSSASFLVVQNVVSRGWNWNTTITITDRPAFVSFVCESLWGKNRHVSRRICSFPLLDLWARVVVRVWRIYRYLKFYVYICYSTNAMQFNTIQYNKLYCFYLLSQRNISLSHLSGTNQPMAESLDNKDFFW